MSPRPGRACHFLHRSLVWQRRFSYLQFQEFFKRDLAVAHQFSEEPFPKLRMIGNCERSTRRVRSMDQANMTSALTNATVAHLFKTSAASFPEIIGSFGIPTLQRDRLEADVLRLVCLQRLTDIFFFTE